MSKNAVVVVVVAAVAVAGACMPSKTVTTDPGPSAVPGTVAVAADADKPKPPPAGVTIATSNGPVHFAVELAIKDADRQRGLMFREHLDDDAGMLFIFETQKPLSFWMKNTHIPLDMLFIDQDGTIAGIVEDAEPLTTSSRKVDKPSRYVLEINGGMSRKLGLAAGQHAHFEQVPSQLVDPRVLQ